jgi:DNA-binding phage protein
MSTVKDVIADAGGVSVVAMAVKLSERSIYKWIEKIHFLDLSILVKVTM